MIKIAITGGLACGKSSVCQYLSDLGAHVVSADEIVHEILRSPNTSIGKKVIALLGSDIVVNDNIDRHAIAKKVFNNSALLSSLEGILHPAVFAEIDRRYRQQSEQEKKFQNTTTDVKSSLFVAEIPLLFEGGGEKYFDYTVAVMAPQEECKRRYCIATGMSEADFDKRMARQLSMEEKGRRADFIIENNGNKEALRCAVEKIYTKFLNI